MGRSIYLLLVLSGLIQDVYGGVTVIGHEIIDMLSDSGVRSLTNSTTFTCQTGDSISWTYNGQVYNFTCGTVEYLYTASIR